MSSLLNSYIFLSTLLFNILSPTHIKQHAKFLFCVFNLYVFEKQWGRQNMLDTMVAGIPGVVPASSFMYAILIAIGWLAELVGVAC